MFFDVTWEVLVFTNVTHWSLSDTTDVQSVEVAEMALVGSVRIQCSFMVGSKATGCIVLLIGEVGNTTKTLSREDNAQVVVVIYKLPYTLSCYHKVFALDMESDGSISSLIYPGVFLKEVNKGEKCSPIKETHPQGGYEIL